MHEQQKRANGIADRLAALVTGRRAKWVILVAWIVVLAVASPLAARLGDVTNNDAVTWLPESAESAQVARLNDRFDAGDASTAMVVYHREGGITADDQAAIEETRGAVASAFPDAELSPPIPSEDGEVLFYTLPLTGERSEIEEDVKALREILAGPPEGLEVAVTGPAGISVDLSGVFDGIDTTLLLASASVVTVLLLIIYRSPFLWVLPLLTVAFASQTATAIVYGMVETIGITVNGQTQGILPILVFGAGTDYALLLIARYREELREEEDTHLAMQRALRRAGPSILASNGTVVIGLLCLVFADLNSNQSLGPVGAAGLLAVLVALLTLLPALLLIVGRRVFWPFVPLVGSGESRGETNIWGRIGEWISHRPRPVWIGTTLVLAIMCLGLLNLDTTLSQEEAFRSTPESITGQQLLAESFPAGASQPTNVIANTSHAAEVEQAIAETPGVANVEPRGESDDGELMSFSVTLSAEPESTEAYDVIEALRDNVHQIEGAQALVGGPDAESLDVYRAVIRDSAIVIPLVLLVILIGIGILLRAVLAPLLLVGSVVLSFGSALGVSVLVFDYIFGFGGLDPAVILLGFVFEVALGIDYNIFLMGRLHEEAKKIGTRQGMLKSLAVTGGVITSAGIVLAATFSVLGILQLVALVQLGFLVAFGILLDTFVVRTVLVPALTFDLGDRIWWPNRLSRS